MQEEKNTVGRARSPHAERGRYARSAAEERSKRGNTDGVEVGEAKDSVEVEVMELDLDGSEADETNPEGEVEILGEAQIEDSHIEELLPVAEKLAHAQQY